MGQAELCREHRCFSPAPWGGRRSPEAGSQSLIQVPTGHEHQQGDLGKPRKIRYLSKITDVKTSSPVPGTWLILNPVQNIKV